MIKNRAVQFRRFFRVIEFTFERTFEFLFFLALFYFHLCARREILQRAESITRYTQSKVTTKYYWSTCPATSMLTDFCHALFFFSFIFNRYLSIEVFEGKSVSSKVVDEIEIYRAASLVLVTQKRSNFSRFIYIYIYVCII